MALDDTSSIIKAANPPSSPWCLQELVCPGADPRWSLAELIHAVVLMAHAHSLCSFVWGCGINPEPDHIGGYTFQPASPGHLPRSPHSPAHEDGRQEVRRLTALTAHTGFLLAAGDTAPVESALKNKGQIVFPGKTLFICSGETKISLHFLV